MTVLRKAWVTVIVDEETCLQALVQMKSLRRTVTTADIVALVEKGVPEHLHSVLGDTFDFVMNFERKSERFNNISALEEGKLFAWTLTMYEACVVADPSILILKNCDELFQSKHLSIFASAEDSTKMDFSLLTIHPSYKIYKTIIAQSTKKDRKNLETIIKTTFHEKLISILDSGRFERITSRQAASNISKAAKLWNSFDEKPWRHLFVDGNEEFTNLSAIWLAVFSEEVLPCLTSYEEITEHLAQQFKPSKSIQLKEGITKEYHNEIKNSIAIVGQSCRLPGANNVGEFWDLLKTGGDGISSIPLEKLPEQYSSDTRFTSIKAGFLKCPINEFDAKFFGISPREAAFMDPQQRLMVEVAWEALEDAAINPLKLKGSNTGVFSGIWTHEYEHLLTENTTGRDFHHVVLGNAFSATSARVSYFLGLNGPNVATESGCSSSMVGLHLACDSLRRRETDLALATGVNLLVHHFPHSEVAILAKDGHCKTFDETADGFARAEGVVVMVVKRLADALRDEDRIYSIIRGSALSNEGTTSSFGTPSKYCQEIAIRDALNVSRVKPENVDYVEAHGTGTPIGDPIEFAAISSAYKAEREKPLIVGSVKTNTGHTESAAGLVGLLKVNLALEKQLIPPHRNLTIVNQNIDLESLPAIIPVNLTDWPRCNDRRRLAGVSSFGISGTNVHIILEEPPVIPKLISQSIEAQRTHHVLTLSAKTENALNDLVDNYRHFLEKNTEFSCKDVCYTTNVGRRHLKHRLAIVVEDSADLKQKLAKQPSFTSEIVINEKVNKVFLFTGQGSQYSGMAKTLYETSPVFKQAFEKCNQILVNNTGNSLMDVLWNQTETQLGNLDDTNYSQAVIFSIEYSLLKLWESFGIKPDYVLGHSVGEFAASVAAGFITLEEALQLVSVRSQLIHNLPQGGMLAVLTNRESVDKMIELIQVGDVNDWVDIAVVNSSHEIVVAGKQTTLRKLSEICMEKNIKTQVIAASHAFHSRDMEGMLKDFGKVANKIKYRSPRCQYVSGSTGEVIRDGEMNGQYWQNHARNTVDFTKGMKFLQGEGCNVFIEIGAHPILLALGMSNLQGVVSHNSLWLPSIRRNEENWVTLLTSISKLHLNGIEIDWEGVHCCYTTKKVSLPHYPFQREKYWIESKSEPISKALHPLLGRKIPLAVVKDQVFKNILDLNEFSYLKDHEVANVIVLPGAGFLEIILAAGKEVLKDDSGKQIVVEDFEVEAPMELEDGKQHTIQVVASQIEESESYLIKIFVYRNMNGYNDEKGWKQFSNAKVSLREYSAENQEFGFQFQQAKTRCTEKRDNMTELYQKTNEIGINFGDAFKSISKVWKGDKEIIAEIPCPKNAGNIKEYIYHPIVLDAMIQTVGICTQSENFDLTLPVGVESFSMVKKSESSLYLAHAFGDEENSSVVVCLYDNNSNLLAVMKGVRLVKTSIGSFMNVINAHKNKLPGMFEVTWRYRDCLLHSRADIPKPDVSNLSDVNLKMQEFNNANEDIIISTRYSGKIGTYSILLAFSKMGWTPKVGETFHTETFLTNLLVQRSQSAFVNRLLCILAEDGYLERCSKENDKWVVLRQLEPIAVLHEKMYALIDEFKALNIKTPDLKLSLHCSENLADVLQGKCTGVHILFGNEDPELNPLIIFREGYAVRLANLRIKFYLQSILNSVKTSWSIVRILEIGAGSAATSFEILNGLQKHGIPCRYTFTDISSHFFEEAKENLKMFSGIEYETLNIEKDPKDQGFVPHSYDIIVAANVIHATEYLSVSLQNVRQLLVPQGLLFLQEMLAPIRYIDLIYGMVDGYWRYKDYDIRFDHPCVTQEVWTNVLEENGFKSVTNISSHQELITDLVAQATDVNPVYSIRTSISSHELKPTIWLIFSGKDLSLSENIKYLIENSGDQATIIYDLSASSKILNDPSIEFLDYSNRQQIFDFMEKTYANCAIKGMLFLFALDGVDEEDLICRTALYIVQHIAQHKFLNRKILCATRGACFIGDQGISYPIQSTVLGLVKSLKNECPEVNGMSLDLDPDVTDVGTDAAQIFSEMWNSDGEFIVAYRQNKRYVMRMTHFKSLQAPLILPSGRYEIVIPKSKKLNDVAFISKALAKLAPNEVEVSVKAMALNFRDIFVILKPEGFYTRMEAVGTDLAGIITRVGENVVKHKIGDEVFGITYLSSAASHVIVPGYLLLPKPKEFTFSEASTLPSVLLTAYLCLVKTADLKRGETILIHVASGGVGLIAIQIAQYLGANIIATAGNKRKRAYLRSIGIEHVFHSRDLTFEEEIKRVTNGNGVDMVLNSLTGHGFKEASLNSCAANARFVEMGKVNIWKTEEVANLRPDVKYTIVNLEKQVGEDSIVELLGGMQEYIDNGTIRPLPYTRFFISQIKDALNYFLKAQHIGKIVVTMPELKESLGKHFTNDLMFNDNGTYLVTGGLGGIGLEVAKWMVKCGATNVVLVGRTAPDDTTKKILKNLSTRGCRVLARQVDVGDLKQCEDLFEIIKSEMPPLRGVIHSAGALSDGMLANQTWEKFQIVFNAKVKGGWNLHHLTKNMQLEVFVLFSSMAAMVGNFAQSNHAAANMFLDALAYYRYSLGLPAQTINWGAWSEVGAAMNTAFGKEGLFGVKPFSPSQGIASLKFCMSRPLLQVCVLQMDFNVFLETFPAFSDTVKELIDGDESTYIKSSAQAEQFWNDIEKLTEEERTLYIKKLIEGIIRQTLKLPESETIDEHQTFSDMGLDSLMAVEMRNKLQHIFGKYLTLNPTSLLDYPTLNTLGKFLAELTMTVNIEAMSVEKNDGESAVDSLELSVQDSILPDSIGKVGDSVPPSKIQTILLTGVTGHLGPYILNELLKHDNTKVICLVRAKSLEAAEKRFELNLRKFNLLDSISMKNVSLIVGDITEDCFGMTSDDYKKLAMDVDAVFHCAAKANHIENYKNSKSKKDIRSVNVLGTHEILKFACVYNAKRVTFASSYSAANVLVPDGCISDELPSDENKGEGIDGGYCLTKFVGEKLMGLAIKRGIPCTVLRFPTLSGHSQTGHFTTDTNFIMSLILGAARLKVFRDIPGGWYSMPVDVAAKISRIIFFSDTTQSGLYNIVESVPVTSEEAVKIAIESGFTIKMVDAKEFAEKLAGDEMMKVFKEGYGDKDPTEIIIGVSPVFKYALSENKRIFKLSSKLLEVVPDIEKMIPSPLETFRLQIKFAKEKGLIESWGIEYNKNI